MRRRAELELILGAAADVDAGVALLSVSGWVLRVAPDTLRCAEVEYPELSVFMEPIVSLRWRDGATLLRFPSLAPPPPPPRLPAPLLVGGVGADACACAAACLSAFNDFFCSLFSSPGQSAGTFI